MKHKIHITAHAHQKWRHLATLHNLDPSNQALINTLETAIPEQPKGRTARFEMLKRSITHGEASTVTAHGIRFVIADNKCVTVEMVKSHENFFPAGRPNEKQGSLPFKP